MLPSRHSWSATSGSTSSVSPTTARNATPSVVPTALRSDEGGIDPPRQHRFFVGAEYAQLAARRIKAIRRDAVLHEISG